MTTPAGADTWDGATAFVLGDTSAPTLIGDTGGGYAAYWTFHPGDTYDVTFSADGSDATDPDSSIMVQLLSGGSDYGSATFVAFAYGNISATVTPAAVYHLVVYLPSGDPVADGIVNYIISSTAVLTGGGGGGGGGTDNTPDAFRATEIDVAYPISLTRSGIVSGTNDPTVSIDAEAINIVPDFQLTILDTKLRRAPTSVTVMVDGGLPDQDIVFLMDSGAPPSGQGEAYTTQLDSDGTLGPLSMTILGDLGGQQGDRVLTAQQTLADATVISATADYHVRLTPIVTETIQGADADAVEVPAALVGNVRRWVLQDLLGEEDGGIGSYIFPNNPPTKSSPHLEHALTSRHTTAHDGQFHIWQAGDMPKEYTFGGFTASEELVGKLEEYRDLNRRFYLIDEHNRAWKVVFENVDIVPRLRLNYNGEITDWGHDYTVTATIVDQNWTVPV